MAADKKQLEINLFTFYGIGIYGKSNENNG
jgi:hypothetical protein